MQCKVQNQIGKVYLQLRGRITVAASFNGLIVLMYLLLNIYFNYLGGIIIIIIIIALNKASEKKEVLSQFLHSCTILILIYLIIFFLSN